MLAVLEPLEASVAACARSDSPPTIDMELLIMPNGHLARATPLGRQAHTELGLCASRALIRARFPASRDGATPRFSFSLAPVR